jgi:hypothetical protein
MWLVIGNMDVLPFGILPIVIEDGQALKVTYPHPRGIIELDLKNKGGKLTGRIVLPAGINGRLVWEEKQGPLTELENKIQW